MYTLYLCNIFFLFMYNLLLCIDGISAGGLESRSTLLILYKYKMECFLKRNSVD